MAYSNLDKATPELYSENLYIRTLYFEGQAVVG